MLFISKQNSEGLRELVRLEIFAYFLLFISKQKSVVREEKLGRIIF